MDIDTGILLALTATALAWFFSIRILEQRKHIKEWRAQEAARVKRTERLKKLYGRL